MLHLSFNLVKASFTKTLLFLLYRVMYIQIKSFERRSKNLRKLFSLKVHQKVLYFLFQHLFGISSCVTLLLFIYYI